MEHFFKRDYLRLFRFFWYAPDFCSLDWFHFITSIDITYSVYLFTKRKHKSYSVYQSRFLSWDALGGNDGQKWKSLVHSISHQLSTVDPIAHISGILWSSNLVSWLCCNIKTDLLERNDGEQDSQQLRLGCWKTKTLNTPSPQVHPNKFKFQVQTHFDSPNCV